jgi:hypothetical protein
MMMDERSFIKNSDPNAAISIGQIAIERLGKQDPENTCLNFSTLAHAYHKAGNKAKAIEFGEKAAKLVKGIKEFPPSIRKEISRPARSL